MSKAIEKQHLYIQMKEASKDPMFIEDLDSAMYDFSYSDYEATDEPIAKSKNAEAWQEFLAEIKKIDNEPITEFERIKFRKVEIC